MIVDDKDHVLALVNRISFAMADEEGNDIALAIGLYIGLNICPRPNDLNDMLSWLGTVANSAITMKRRGKLKSTVLSCAAATH